MKEVFLLVRVQNNSEFDTTNIFVMKITQDKLDILTNLKNSLKSVESIKNFNCLSVFENMGLFLCDDFGTFDDLLHDESTYKIVSADEFNLEELTHSESPKDTHMIDVRKGGFVFECYGKYTGEQFYTLAVYWSALDEMLSVIS